MNEERLQQARRLVDALEAGNESVAEGMLDELTAVRQSALHSELRRLTRQLQESLNAVMLDKRVGEIAKTAMPDARERLRYVLEQTEKAANRTLSAVEASLPIASYLQRRAETLLVANDAATQQEVVSFLQDVSDNSDRLRAHLTDALMAQDFQDLTAQVIRPVMDLARELEEQLVSMVHTYGVTEGTKATSPPRADGAAAGPRPALANGASGPPALPNDDYLADQDDVDALLKRLGV